MGRYPVRSVFSDAIALLEQKQHLLKFVAQSLLVLLITWILWLLFFISLGYLG